MNELIFHSLNMSELFEMKTSEALVTNNELISRYTCYTSIYFE